MQTAAKLFFVKKDTDKTSNSRAKYNSQDMSLP